MNSSIKPLFKSFYRLPENLPASFNTSSFYRSYVWINYVYFFAAIAHFFFIILFALLGVQFLAIFNFFSILCWLFAIYMNQKMFTNAAFFLVNTEVIAHAFISTIMLGWESGFHYYVLGIPMGVFLGTWKKNKKIFIVTINGISYAAVHYVSQFFGPITPLKPYLLSKINYINIFTLCFLLSYSAYHYTRAADSAEAELEKEHKRANEALLERNKMLTLLNEELSEAANYVKTMLPKPISAGFMKTNWRFIPSSSLGGDAFGYHWLDHNNFAIYLLDVSGHGVGAALLSVSVLDVLRSQSLKDTDFHDPGQVLRGLNTNFQAEKHNDMFFTIWYGVYNQTTQNLEYASGGHPPALLFTETFPRKSNVSKLQTSNLVIGGMQDIYFKKKTKKINVPSRLYVFSDGVYEVAKTDGSMWRFAEFYEFMCQTCLEDKSAIDRLYNHARELNRKDVFEDDFTIIEVVFG